MSDKRPGPFSGFFAVGSSTAVAWSVAALLAFASLWIGQLYVLSRAENRLLHDQQQFTELELRNVSQHAEAERLLARRELIDASAEIERLTNRAAVAPRDAAGTGNDSEKAQMDARGQSGLEGYRITLLSPGNGSSPAARAVALWNPRTQQGVLRAEGLPAVASGHSYRLWLVAPSHPAPVDGGTIAADSGTGMAQVSFHPQQQVNGSVTFIVSLEAVHDVSRPTGPIVLSGE